MQSLGFRSLVDDFCPNIDKVGNNKLTKWTGCMRMNQLLSRNMKNPKRVFALIDTQQQKSKPLLLFSCVILTERWRVLSGTVSHSGTRLQKVAIIATTKWLQGCERRGPVTPPLGSRDAKVLQVFRVFL